MTWVSFQWMSTDSFLLLYTMDLSIRITWITFQVLFLSQVVFDNVDDNDRKESMVLCILNILFQNCQEFINVIVATLENQSMIYYDKYFWLRCLSFLILSYDWYSILSLTYGLFFCKCSAFYSSWLKMPCW